MGLVYDGRGDMWTLYGDWTLYGMRGDMWTLYGAGI